MPDAGPWASARISLTVGLVRLVTVLINPGRILPVDMPLQGMDSKLPFPRWVHAFVPILFFAFLVPGLAYGIAARKIGSDKDVAKMMGKAMPTVTIIFFGLRLCSSR